MFKLMEKCPLCGKVQAVITVYLAPLTLVVGEAQQLSLEVIIAYFQLHSGLMFKIPNQ